MVTQVQTSNTKKKSKAADETTAVETTTNASTSAEVPQNAAAPTQPSAIVPLTSTGDDKRSAGEIASEFTESHLAALAKIGGRVSSFILVQNLSTTDATKANHTLAQIREKFTAMRDAGEGLSGLIASIAPFVEKAKVAAKIVAGSIVRIKNTHRLDAKGNRKFANIPLDELDMLEVVRIVENDITVKLSNGTECSPMKLSHVELADEPLTAGTLAKVAPKFLAKYADMVDDVKSLNDVTVFKSVGAFAMVNASGVDAGTRVKVKRTHLLLNA